MKIMLIDARDDHFRVAVKQDGKVISRCDVKELHEAHGIAIADGQIPLVFVACGFRSGEVFAMCRRFGWTAVRGVPWGDECYYHNNKGELYKRVGPFGIADEIEAATTLAGAGSTGGTPVSHSTGETPVPQAADGPACPQCAGHNTVADATGLICHDCRLFFEPEGTEEERCERSFDFAQDDIQREDHR